MKYAEKQIAINLRKNGLSYRDIQKQVRISRSTLGFWLRDIPLTQEQNIRLLSNREYARQKGSRSQMERRIRKTESLLAFGESEFLKFNNEPLFISGLLLYWAEGDKHCQESVKFTNSDPQMIGLMMKWFRKICHVPEQKFRIAVNIHDLLVRHEVEDYWSKITKIPLSQFHKTYVKKSSLRLRRNLLYNGTCAIVIHNKDLFRKIMGWKQGLIKFFKIRPRSSMDRTPAF